jgi:hypothetical protein
VIGLNARGGEILLSVNSDKSTEWTRRRLLRTAPAVLAPSLIPRQLHAMIPGAPVPPPFSKFVDVAHSAGLTEMLVYGETKNVKYIIESTGAGCAFFFWADERWTTHRPVPATGCITTIAMAPSRM